MLNIGILAVMATVAFLAGRYLQIWGIRDANTVDRYTFVYVLSIALACILVSIDMTCAFEIFKQSIWTPIAVLIILLGGGIGIFSVKEKECLPRKPV